MPEPAPSRAAPTDAADLRALPLQPLYGSRALAHWVRAGGRPERGLTGYALRLWWHAVWFEQNWRTQTPRLAALPAPEDPLFILGLWRSGTTVLHELLAACTGWLTPQTWQCFSPSTCFLTAAPSRQAVTVRPMDQGHIATLGPQEDEFALLLLGEPSLYRAFIDPRRLPECSELEWTLSATPSAPGSLDASARSSALPRWQAFVRGIAAQDRGRRLLLKSPNHTFRLPLLRALYPGARYVWIGRHAGEVLTSNLRMWRAMMALYALWPCPPGLLESFLQDVLRAAAQLLERCLAEMPRESLLWIDFEELQAEPRRTLERVLEFAGTGALTHAELQRGLQQALDRVPVHAGARSDMPDNSTVQQFQHLMHAARQRFGGQKPAHHGAAAVAPRADPR